MFMQPGIRVIQQVSSEISAISLEYDYTASCITLLNARMAFNNLVHCGLYLYHIDIFKRT